jgi:hypothetical protein
MRALACSWVRRKELSLIRCSEIAVLLPVTTETNDSSTKIRELNLSYQLELCGGSRFLGWLHKRCDVELCVTDELSEV